MSSFVDFWLLGSAFAVLLGSLDYELRDKNFDADCLLGCILFSWLVVAMYTGSVIAKRIKRKRKDTVTTDTDGGGVR